MRASEAAVLALSACLALACAEGYPMPGSSGSAVVVPITGGAGGSSGSGGMPAAGGMGGAGALGGMGGAPAPSAEPCVENDVQPCACEGSAAMGRRICVFDPTSPTQGRFSECRDCPTAMPLPSCTDGMQNGAETGTDCGGPECMACAMSTGGSGGAGATGGSGGTAGEAGSSGEGGSGGEEPTGPVEDCSGAPEGTECDRQCIFPGNTARCNAQGECSCLN